MKLAQDSQKDTEQMEKKLAELDVTFASVVKFANRLESKADANEMEVDKIKAALKGSAKSLKDVDPKSKKFAPQAKKLQKQISDVEKMMRDFGAMREYAPQLRKSFVEFRKLKNEAKWGTKIDDGKKVAAFLNDLGKGLEALAKAIEKE